MTKAEELNCLDAFIDAMDNTYIGEWLADQRDAIKSGLEMDMMVYAETFDKRKARIESEIEHRLACARAEAKRIVADAQGRAERINEATVRTRDELCRDLRTALRRFEEM